MKELQDATKVVFPQLSYKIIGILFDIHTSLGNRYQEKYYQRAVAIKLRKAKIPYEQEIAVDLEIEGEKIGKYFLDFLIDEKIVLELKVKPLLTKHDYKQVRAYLHACNLKLGLLANFYGESLQYKRILNSKIFESNS